MELKMSKYVLYLSYDLVAKLPYTVQDIVIQNKATSSVGDT
jgi:hypothetical protein